MTFTQANLIRASATLLADVAEDIQAHGGDAGELFQIATLQRQTAALLEGQPTAPEVPPAGD